MTARRRRPTHAAPAVPAGFGLVQALIAVVIVGTAIISVVMWQSRQAQAVAYTSVVDAQAREMAMLHRALTDYTKTNKTTLDTWHDGAAHTLVWSVLTTDQKLLPDDFGRRFNQVGLSPVGAPYWFAARARGTAAKPEETVWAITLGTNLERGLLSRLGIQPTDAAIAAFGRAVAAQASTKYGVPAGLIDPSLKTAHGVGTAWTKDLGVDFGSLPVTTDARPVVLVGFPDLEPGGESPGGGGPGNSGSKWDKVQLAWPEAKSTYSGNTWTPATCPAGTEVIVEWPSCAPLWGRGDVAYGSDIGTVTFGVRSEEIVSILRTALIDPDSYDCMNDFPDGCTWQYQTFYGSTDFVDVYLNGAKISPEGGSWVGGTCKTKYPTAQGWIQRNGACGRTRDISLTPSYPCAIPRGFSNLYGPGVQLTTTALPDGSPVTSKLCGVRM